MLVSLRAKRAISFLQTDALSAAGVDFAADFMGKDKRGGRDNQCATRTTMRENLSDVGDPHVPLTRVPGASRTRHPAGARTPEGAPVFTGESPNGRPAERAFGEWDGDTFRVNAIFHRTRPEATGG